jgi:hypothetical protein
MNDVLEATRRAITERDPIGVPGAKLAFTEQELIELQNSILRERPPMRVIEECDSDCERCNEG